MRNFFFSLFFVFAGFCSNVSAQTIPASRTVDWSVAGLSSVIASPSTVIDITTVGGIGDGVTPNDNALQQTIAQLGGNFGVIYFPPGSYLFNATVNLPDSVILRGQGSDQSILLFDLGGAANDLITVNGSLQATEWTLAQDAYKNDSIIVTSALSGVAPGDVLRLYQDDSALVFSSWAYKSVGQIVRVKAVSGNLLTLENPLRKDYAVSDAPRFRKMTPKKRCGLECLKIERLDATVAQTSNISFTYAVDCFLRGVESSMCNFGHVTVSYSSNIHIEGCYFHHAFAYGSGGQGYGVVLQYTSGECLAENNVFDHLRHSMLLQSGANGNVLAYNYSVDPYWTSFPNNAAGDIVLHGNYPYANLFEGNIAQNIVIDASHGINGPHNTFFRNRAELYGTLMSNNPASDQQNFAGNEVTGTGTFMGNYTLAGSGHFEFGNAIQGTITPTGTSNLPENSLFAAAPPAYLPAWPGIGPPYAYHTGDLPARTRFQFQSYTTCNSTVSVFDTPGRSEELRVYPNPASSALTVTVGGTAPAEATLYDFRGRRCDAYFFLGSVTMDVSRLPAGMYMLVVEQDGRRVGRVVSVVGR